MKKLLYLFMFLYLGTWGELSAQMLLFKGTFEEALKKAQAEKKDLFVDLRPMQNNGRQYIYTARSR